MPNRYFEDGSEIVIEDFNSISKAMQRELYDRLAYELIQRSEDAFFDDSFLVSYASANSIVVKKGLGFQTDATQVSPEPRVRPLYLSADSNQLIEAPDVTNDRIDLVCIKHDKYDELTGSRKVKDAISNIISTETLVVQQDWQAEILLVAGTPNVSPVAPATPAGYIAIAEIEVTAVSGISGPGAITDLRSIVPIGGGIQLNTLGKVRVTAGASVPLATLISDIDNLLKFGYQEYTDFEDLSSDPAAPTAASNKKRFYCKNGVFYFRDEAPGGLITPIGSGGGGGGGGANWQPVSGLSPTESYEYDEKVWQFEKDATQALTLWVRVPAGYLSGRQITMKGGFYSPASADQWKFQAVTTLIRKNNDAITSVANQHTDDSGDITNAVANRMNELSFDLSSSVGAINGFAISPGDIIKVQVSRIAPSGTEDIEDVRFIPSSTEVIFS